MLAGWIPSEAVREGLFPASPPASDGMLALSGLCWNVEASPLSLHHLHLHPRGVLPECGHCEKAEWEGAINLAVATQTGS